MSRRVPIITLNIPFLYHATMRNLEDIEMKRNYAERPMLYPHWHCPPPGEIANNCIDTKFFTVIPLSSYGFITKDGEHWCFLRYQVLRPLRLYDIRKFSQDSPEYMDLSGFSRFDKEPQVDGYIGRGRDE